MSSLKTLKAKELVKKFELENRRFIVFNGSIAQTDELLGKKWSIHSKKSTKQNAETIQKFNSLEYDKISTCGMLTEGMNLNKLDTVMIVQLDSGEMNNSLKSIQQLGRIREKDPELYIIYVENTKDSDYVDNTINAIGREYLVK